MMYLKSYRWQPIVFWLMAEHPEYFFISLY